MTTASTAAPIPATTITSPDDLGELPGLITGDMPAELADLGAPWSDLLAARKDRVSRAKRARRAFDKAVSSLPDAKTADQRATLAAVRDGNAAPSPDHALAALAEIERLHREADAATRLANDTAIDLKKAIKGEPGDEAMATLDDLIATARARATDTLAAADEALADLGTLVGVRATIPATRKTHGVLAGSARRGHDGLGRLHLNSGPEQGAAGLLGALAATVAGRTR